MRRYFPAVAAFWLLFGCGAWAEEPPVAPEHVESVKKLPDGTIKIVVSFTLHRPAVSDQMSVNMTAPLNRAAKTVCGPKGFAIIAMGGTNEPTSDGSIVVHDEGTVRCR